MQDVLRINPAAIMIIKSTVPVGYTRALRQRLGTDRLFFSPEFLREGGAARQSLPFAHYCWRSFDAKHAVRGYEVHQSARIDVIVHEPALDSEELFRSRALHDPGEFKQASDVIVANRVSPKLCDVIDEVYACDLFGNGETGVHSRRSTFNLFMG